MQTPIAQTPTEETIHPDFQFAAAVAHICEYAKKHSPLEAMAMGGGLNALSDDQLLLLENQLLQERMRRRNLYR